MSQALHLYFFLEKRVIFLSHFTLLKKTQKSAVGLPHAKEKVGETCLHSCTNSQNRHKDG